MRTDMGLKVDDHISDNVAAYDITTMTKAIPGSQFLLLLVLSTLLSQYTVETSRRQSDHNPSIDFLTPSSEVTEGSSSVEFRCKVTLPKDHAVKPKMEWTFVPKDGDEEVVLAVDGEVRPDLFHHYTAKRRSSWDAVNDIYVLEHNLKISGNLTQKDEGLYSCQVNSSNPGSMVAKRSFLSVVPHPTSTSQLKRGGNFRSRHGEENRPTMGPITERFVVATRGSDVILECRDADENWVWKKQGDPKIKGEGKNLRLFVVDRWDSGLYYCSTNTSFSSHHNVTLSVEHPPKVTIQTFGAEEVRQAIGHPVVLKCKVEATPVPQISWYQLVDAGRETIMPIEDADLSHDHVEDENLRRLRSSDDYAISIDAYKDGMVQSSLQIDAATKGHFGKYKCEATNKLGHDSSYVLLEESATPVDLENMLLAGDAPVEKMSSTLTALAIGCAYFYYYMMF